MEGIPSPYRRIPSHAVFLLAIFFAFLLRCAVVLHSWLHLGLSYFRYSRSTVFIAFRKRKKHSDCMARPQYALMQ